MVRVNILQLLTVCVLQFIINNKTLHLLFRFTHWECRSGSGHRYQISSGGDENYQIRHLYIVTTKRNQLLASYLQFPIL